MTRSLCLRTALAAALLLAAAGAGATPRLTYSGTLLASDGRPVTTATALQFRFYGQETGGTPLWEDVVIVTPDGAGRFVAVLGASAQNSVDLSAFAGPTWLGLQVAGDATEMSPRMPVTSSPSALVAETVDWAGVSGKPSSFPVDTASVQARVAGTCSGNQFVQTIASDGTVGCASPSALAWSGLTGVPASFPPGAHQHAAADVTGKVASAVSADTVPWTGVSGVPAGLPPGPHQHPGADVTSQVASAAVADAVPWTGVSGAPATYPPGIHTHAGADVTSQVANAAAAAAVPWTGVTGRPAAYPAAAHTHAGADVTSQVANAAAVPWTGVTGRPATYPAAAHAHGNADLVLGLSFYGMESYSATQVYAVTAVHRFCALTRVGFTANDPGTWKNCELAPQADGTWVLYARAGSAGVVCYVACF